MSGLEACARASRVSAWVSFWEEEERQYMLERGSNKAGGFIQCLVGDIGGKRFILMFLEARGLARGWKILSNKL